MIEMAMTQFIIKQSQLKCVYLPSVTLLKKKGFMAPHCVTNFKIHYKRLVKVKEAFVGFFSLTINNIINDRQSSQ